MSGIVAAMGDTRPVGVFDSGVGGLTVLHELHRRLPGERLRYIADLAHFPYGPRYQHEVRELALRIIGHLVSADHKLIVIACNTASAAALNAARERFDVPIVGVISPGAQAAVEATGNGRVAVLSTEGTRASQEYIRAIGEVDARVGVLSLAAPGLVEIVEAGDAAGEGAEAALRPLVEEVLAWGADTLVLGCTHYPLLRTALERVLDGHPLHIVDSAETTAARVERVLAANRLRAPTGLAAPAPELAVTAAPERFSLVASRLFGGDLAEPALLRLWDEPACAVS